MSIAFKKRQRAALAIKVLNRSVNVSGMDTGPTHSTGQTQSSGHKFTRFAHQAQLTGRFQLGTTLEELS